MSKNIRIVENGKEKEITDKRCKKVKLDRHISPDELEKRINEIEKK